MRLLITACMAGASIAPAFFLPQAAPVVSSFTGDASPADGTLVELIGTVSDPDKGTYQEHRFEVPPGVTRLDVEFSHEHRGSGTELEIGLFDGVRFRGTSRFSKQRFHLAELDATPSYVPGPIVPGTWRLSLGIPSVRAGTTSSWRVLVGMSRASTPPAGLGGVRRSHAGWYAGDLHAHTLHSDGYGCEDASTPGTTRGCQPWEVVEAARARKLDFLAVTDHNTTSHHADLATLQESLTDLLLLRGQEMTTFRGHANIYGTGRVIDFRLGFRGRSMRDVLDDVDREGAVLSINHPGRETGDRCTGCGWDAPQTPWERIEAMEVVNGGVIEGATAGLPIWYARLNDRHRITGIGGSDEHGAHPNGRIGSPATVIYADELSEAGLLRGIRSGRVYVRTRGPEGPALGLTASAGNSSTQMGGVLTIATAATLRLDVIVERALGQQLEVVRNAHRVATLPVTADTGAITHALLGSPGDWVHVRLRDGSGLTAFSNPVYLRSVTP